MFPVSVHQFLEQNVTPIEKLKAVRGMDMENLKFNPHSEPQIVDSPQVQILAWAPTGCLEGQTSCLSFLISQMVRIIRGPYSMAYRIQQYRHEPRA